MSIPRAEVARILRDEELESAATASTSLPRVSSDGSPVLVAARNGGNFRVDGIRPEPDGRARLTANGGSVTMAERDVLAILRVPRGVGIPEVWLFATSSGADAVTDGPSRPAGARAHQPPVSGLRAVPRPQPDERSAREGGGLLD